MGQSGGRDWCVRCGRVRGVRPGFGAKLGFWGAVGVALALLLGAPMMGIGLIGAAPVLMAMGLGLGPLASAAFADPTCPKCACVVERAHEGEAVVTTPASVAR